MDTTKRYSPGVLERAVQLVFVHEAEHSATELNDADPASSSSVFRRLP